MIMLLTAAAFCNDNSHSMVQKKEEAKIWTRNTCLLYTSDAADE